MKTERDDSNGQVLATAPSLGHVFVHAEAAPPKPVSVAPGDTLAKVLRRAGIELGEGLNVFVGDWKAVIDEEIEIDDGEDEHVCVHLHDTIEVIGIGRGVHIHCHRCHRIKVIVHYQSHSKHHRFSPAQTVETVTKWARRKFCLSDIDAEKLKLMICGTQTQPRGNETLGELVHAPACEICFDLVPDPKVNG